MQVTRRNFTLGAGLLALSACGGGLGAVGQSAARPAATTFRAAPNAGFDTWVAGFRGRAIANGIAAGTVDRAFARVGFLPDVVDRDRNQTEFTRTLEDYLAIAASDERISKGRAALARNQVVLSQIEARFGVEAEVVTAVWGLESFFGERRGDVPVISALSTLAYDGRRGAFFEQQLIAALKILQNGDVSVDGMTGSWAGAMGHTQFIPTSYLLFAVDFNGDGRRDIWSEDPTDALASTAAYLARSGWTKGLRWGNEVAGDASGPVIQPQAGGPRFAVTSNFRAIKRYNNSDAYAIGVGHLADRIGGGGPLRGAFPPDANGMTKDDRIDLQRRLTAAGFDTEGSDGVIGPKTRAAISAYQRRAGLAETGEPTLDLLQRLR